MFTNTVGGWAIPESHRCTPHEWARFQRLFDGAEERIGIRTVQAEVSITTVYSDFVAVELTRFSDLKASFQLSLKFMQGLQVRRADICEMHDNGLFDRLIAFRTCTKESSEYPHIAT